MRLYLNPEEASYLVESLEKDKTTVAQTIAARLQRCIDLQGNHKTDNPT